MKLQKPELMCDKVRKEKPTFSIDQKEFQFPLGRFFSSLFAQHPGGFQMTAFKLAEAGTYRLFPHWSSVKEILTISFQLIKISLSQKSHRIVIILDTRQITNDRGCEWAGWGQNS